MKYKTGQFLIVAIDKIKVDESICNKIDSWSSYNARKSTTLQPSFYMQKDASVEVLNVSSSEDFYLLYNKDLNCTFRARKTIIKTTFALKAPYYHKIWNEVNEISID